jgi:hypothetical protein
MTWLKIPFSLESYHYYTPRGFTNVLHKPEFLNFLLEFLNQIYSDMRDDCAEGKTSVEEYTQQNGLWHLICHRPYRTLFGWCVVLAQPLIGLIVD